MPAMMGFMMGRMMGGGFGAAAPVYRDTNNTAYSGRQTVGRIDSARMPPPQRIAGSSGAPAWGKPARGGFGRSGFGASS